MAWASSTYASKGFRTSAIAATAAHACGQAVYLCGAAPCANARICRRQGLPDCHGAGTSGPQVHAVWGPVIVTTKLITGHDAVGERRNPGQDDPGAAGVLDLDPGSETGTGPRASSGPDPAGGHARVRAAEPATAVQAVRRRRMRLPGASVSLIRHHAERRGRSGRTRADPTICADEGSRRVVR